MTENIQASIKHEVSLSMKEGNKFRTVTLRLIVSAFQVEEINKKEELTDKECIEILEKMIKQRKDSISQFESAGREELSKKEKELHESFIQTLGKNSIWSKINQNKNEIKEKIKFNFQRRKIRKKNLEKFQKENITNQLNKILKS